MWKSRFAVPAALTLSMALPASALALGEEMDHLKRENAEMKRMLMQMQKQLQEVMMKTNALQQQAEKTVEGAGRKGGIVKSRKEAITLSTTGGGLQVKSSKGHEFKIGGMLQWDHDSYDDFWGADDAEENKIRRSRIAMSGKSGKNWSYQFTANIDHEGGNDFIDTGFLKYSSKPVYVRIGKYKRPGMLEARTSANWISTIERSIVNELSGAVLAKPSFGGVEVGFATQGDLPTSGSIGLFDNEVDEPDGSDVYGMGGRFSLAPKLGEGSFLHAGASFYTVDYKGNNYRMRSRMGLSNTGRPFETDPHATDDIDQFGLELAYVNGPFSLQGEFMNMESGGTDNNACGTVEYTPGAAAKEPMPVLEDGKPVYLVDGDGNPRYGDKYLVMRVATGVPDDPGTDAKDESMKDVRVDLGLSQEDLEGYEVGQPFGAVDIDKDGTVDGTVVDSTAVGDFIVRQDQLMKMTEAVNAAEAMFGDVSNTCDIEMDGFYLQAAYTLTGETRGYKAGSGAFAAIKPKNEGGAWEVVARYEDAEVDIPGRSLSADLERMVLGVNWYVNRNVKFMLNYVDSEVDGCSETSRTIEGGPVLERDREAMPEGFENFGIKKCSNDDGEALSLRGQYVF